MALLGQSPDSVTETTHENWFSRMGGALVALLVSPFVMSLSIAVLWINERRAARMDALIAYAQQECVSVEKASAGDRGELVHVASGRAVAKAPVESKPFRGVSMKGCLRVRTRVEVFQWIEKSETQEKSDGVGGGKTTTTVYSYEKTWDSVKHDSASYRNKRHTNKFPVAPVVDVTEAPHVEYAFGASAAGWVLPAGLVCQFSNFESAVNAIGADRVICQNGTILRRDGSNADYFYSEARGDPQIGDVRATFEYVPDNQDATIVALQSPSKKASTTETFLPYRPIQRGWGLSDESRKTALLKEGERSHEELAAADEIKMGPLACLCCCCLCCCSLVSRFMTQISPPEIFNLYPGSATRGECFSRIQQGATNVKWILRIVGWLCLQMAMMMFLQPMFMLVNVVPFLEYLHISGAIEAVVFVLALIFTAMVSSLIVCVAYLAYRPLVAMVYLGVGVAIAAVPLSIYMGYVGASTA